MHARSLYFSRTSFLTTPATAAPGPRCHVMFMQHGATQTGLRYPRVTLHLEARQLVNAFSDFMKAFLGGPDV
eukprot:CAMPEP_0172880628 /NCGR_PEP_ID=MMETSP1075-20121228/115566_1 /TAXON_ID=2916 /ORGANISM="Ceratium fusus, Strain PA161109" /LENGTH=71 /DNA_ID=CAMNT_0013732907 /DNA_START=178 /DNA_END=390 /DNA_ORIENTATION=+